jgi:hypothetical protein
MTLHIMPRQSMKHKIFDTLSDALLVLYRVRKLIQDCDVQTWHLAATHLLLNN